MHEVKILEVGPRDGLQGEKDFVPTEIKIDFLNRLAASGLTNIEATSFVNPYAIPQLKDAEEVMAKVERYPGVNYYGLVANANGMKRAVNSGMDAVRTLVSASETHNRNNVKMSVRKSLEEIAKINDLGQKAGTPVWVSVAMAFDCPFEGMIKPDAVLDIVGRFHEMGMKVITLADSTGSANPERVRKLVTKVKDRFPDVEVGLHLHDTRGLGLANAYAGWQAGANIFEGSVGGLGGCPFTPGSTGNVCTEDMVYMWHGMDLETGVNIASLIECARFMEQVVAKELPGRVMRHGISPVVQG